MSKCKVRREDLPPGGCLCDHCTGKCCRYFSLPITTPTTRRDYSVVSGYLGRRETLVYVEKDVWYLVVSTLCQYLTRDNRCKIYLNRPKVCQEYTTADCEYDTDWTFEKVFETPEQLWEYAESVLPRPRRVATRADQGANGKSAPAPRVPFTIPIDTPTTWDDYDAIRWYLAHERTAVFVRDRRWYVLVFDRAEKGAAQHVPLSRLVATPGRPVERVFETAEQLWEYAEAILPPRRRPRPRGNGLPIVTLGPS